MDAKPQTELEPHGSFNWTEERQYVWNYWLYHSDQRIKTFNLFILFVSVIVTGALAFVKDSKGPFFLIPFGLLIIFLCWVFWRLDARSRSLIKHAETYLMKIEDSNGLSMPFPTTESMVFGNSEKSNNQTPDGAIARGLFRTEYESWENIKSKWSNQTKKILIYNPLLEGCFFAPPLSFRQVFSYTFNAFAVVGVLLILTGFYQLCFVLEMQRTSNSVMPTQYFYFNASGESVKNPDKVSLPTNP